MEVHIMPTINKLQHQKREGESQRNEHTPERVLRQKAYQSAEWKKIRKVYLIQHPLCEECLSKGIINAGTLEQPLSIHHLKSPFQNGEINWALLTDIENLRTLCPKCHQEEHLKQKYGDSRTPEKIIEDLERLLNGEGNMENN